MSLVRSAALASVVALVACTAGSSDDADSDEAAQTGTSREDYDFQLPGPNDELVRVDAMGVALLSTVLANRDRTPSGEDAKNRYQIDSPDVQNNPATLLSFVTFLHRLHVYWRDNLKQLGFLEMGGKCPGIDTMAGVSDETKRRVPRDADGVPICTIETFADIPLQVATNDRPFESGFPYLAKPWFYAAGAPYYWPTSKRLDLPE